MKYNSALCLILVLFICSLKSIGQNRKISFDYDNNGNQVKRSLCEGCIQQQPKDTLPMLLGADTAMLIDLTPSKDADGNKTISGEMKLVNKQAIGERVAVYPNPTDGDLFIRLENLPEITSVEILVRDMAGRVVYSTTKILELYSFSLAGQPAGTYLINLTVNDHRGYYTVIKE